MNLKAVVSILLLICFSDSLHAQEKPELFSRVERVFREKEPSWKVEQANQSTTSDPMRQNIVFRSGDNQASVDITVWRREQDTGGSFTGQALAFDNTAGKRMVKSRLPKVGDENYIWTNRGSAAWPTLIFRKGNVTVTVFGPSVAVVKRFARHVIKQMGAG